MPQKELRLVHDGRVALRPYGSWLWLMARQWGPIRKINSVASPPTSKRDVGMSASPLGADMPDAGIDGCKVPPADIDHRSACGDGVPDSSIAIHRVEFQ